MNFDNFYHVVRNRLIPLELEQAFMLWYKTTFNPSVEITVWKERKEARGAFLANMVGVGAFTLFGWFVLTAIGMWGFTVQEIDEGAGIAFVVILVIALVMFGIFFCISFAIHSFCVFFSKKVNRKELEAFLSALESFAEWAGFDNIVGLFTTLPTFYALKERANCILVNIAQMRLETQKKLSEHTANNTADLSEVNKEKRAEIAELFSQLDTLEKHMKIQCDTLDSLGFVTIKDCYTWYFAQAQKNIDKGVPIDNLSAQLGRRS